MNSGRTRRPPRHQRCHDHTLYGNQTRNLSGNAPATIVHDPGRSGWLFRPAIFWPGLVRGRGGSSRRDAAPFSIADQAADISRNASGFSLIGKCLRPFMMVASQPAHRFGRRPAFPPACRNNRIRRTKETAAAACRCSRRGRGCRRRACRNTVIALEHAALHVRQASPSSASGASGPTSPHRPTLRRHGRRGGAGNSGRNRDRHGRRPGR